MMMYIEISHCEDLKYEISILMILVETSHLQIIYEVHENRFSNKTNNISANHEV